MNRYKLVIEWNHPQWGPQMEKLAAEGSSIRRALNSSLLAFFKDKNKREKRRAAHAALTVTIRRNSAASKEASRGK